MGDFSLFSKCFYSTFTLVKELKVSLIPGFIYDGLYKKGKSIRNLPNINSGEERENWYLKSTQFCLNWIDKTAAVDEQTELVAEGRDESLLILFLYLDTLVCDPDTHQLLNYHLRTEPAQYTERLAFTSAGLSEISDSCVPGSGRWPCCLFWQSSFVLPLTLRFKLLNRLQHAEQNSVQTRSSFYYPLQWDSFRATKTSELVTCYRLHQRMPFTLKAFHSAW